jgi:hypothetical protein
MKLYGIWGGQSATGTGVSLSTWYAVFVATQTAYEVPAVSWQHKNCNVPNIYIEAQLSNSSTVRTSTVQQTLWDISPLYSPYSNTTLHSGQPNHTGVHPSPILAESTCCYIRARPTTHELKLATEVQLTI